MSPVAGADASRGGRRLRAHRSTRVNAGPRGSGSTQAHVDHGLVPSRVPLKGDPQDRRSVGSGSSRETGTGRTTLVNAGQRGPSSPDFVPIVVLAFPKHGVSEGGVVPDSRDGRSDRLSTRSPLPSG